MVSRDESQHVTIVGGGIAGLYTAYLLARHGCTIELFELNKHTGGKIATRGYPERNPEFLAEFGPMRFEFDLQFRLQRLCTHLGLRGQIFR